MRALFPFVFIAALCLSSCAPAQDDPTAGLEGETMGAGPDSPSDDGSVPQAFADTAWRITSEDGARYTTMLDRDGTYRDLRNGDPWQQGNWTFTRDEDDKQLCFIPDAENGVERCWTPGRMDGDRLIATGPGEQRIALKQVEYEPDESAEEDEVQ